MNKKFLFVLVTFLCLLVGLYSCSSDKDEPESSSKIIYENINYEIYPKSLTAIVEGRANPSITSINIPATFIYKKKEYTVTSIKRGAFNNTDIIRVNLPNTITEIGGSAFNGCINLTSINLPNKLKAIAGGTFGDSGIISITIPSSVSSIGGYAFAGCKSLKSIVIEDGSSPILLNEFTFSSSPNLGIYYPPVETLYIGRSTSQFPLPTPNKSLTIGQYVKNISLRNSFKEPITIKSFPITPPSVDAGFQTSKEGFKIYVPTASIDLYKSSSFWNQFPNIQGF